MFKTLLTLFLLGGCTLSLSAQADAIADYQEAQNLYLRHSYDSALVFFEQAEHAFLEAQASKSDLLKASIGKGDTYAAQQQTAEALAELSKSYSQAEDAQSKLFEAYRSARIAFLEHDYLAAITRFEQLLRDLPQSGLTLWHARVNFWLGDLFLKEERYEKALEHLSEATLLYQNLGTRFNSRLAKIYLNIGRAYTGLEQPREAQEWYIKSFQVAISFFGQVHIAVAQQHLEIAASCSRQGNNGQAQDCYNAALGIVQQLQDVNRIYELRVHIGLGLRLHDKGLLGPAQKRYEIALRQLPTVLPDKHPLAARLYHQVARLHYELGDYTQAQSYADKAINATLTSDAEVEMLENINYEQVLYPFELIPSLLVKLDLLTAMADQANSTKYLTDGLAAAQQARLYLLHLRQEEANKRQKFKISQLTRELCDRGVALCYALLQREQQPQHLETAFMFSESSKASILLEALRDLQARKISGVPESLIEQERTLKVQLSYYHEEIYYELQQGTAEKGTRLDTLRTEAAQAHLQYEDLLQEIKQLYPSYFTLKYSAKTASIQSVQENLKDDELLVEYLVRDDHIFIFTVDKNGAKLKKVAYEGSLRAKMLPFMVALKTRQYEDFKTYSVLLYDLLIRPIKAEVEAKRSLFIVPDADLNYISFELLMPQANENAQGDYRKFDMLLQKHIVFYNYSATLFIQGRQLRTSTAQNVFMGIAPDFTSSDFSSIRGKLSSKDDTSSVFQQLPAAIEEVENISARLTGLPIIGRKATESAFKAQSSQSKIIHLATHAVVNNQNPLYSKLILLDDAENDGLLHTYELYNMQLDAELVTLSACNSGIGQFRKGEGVMSIARGFYYAGTPNIVMSLWPVPDATTKQLMDLFYKHIADGLPKHEALHQAKMDFLNQGNAQTSAPFYWGGFVVLGNSEPIDLELHTAGLSFNGWPWYYLLIGVSVVLLSVGIALSRR